MAIGSDLDLDKMLRDFGLLTLRKLNCTALAVFEERISSEGPCFERVFLSPRVFERAAQYAEIEKMLPGNMQSHEVAEFYGRLPLESRLDGGMRLHLMELPGYGVIAILRSRSSFPPEVLDSFVHINGKLSLACQACLAHRRLKASEEQYRSLIHSMQEGVAVVDSSGVFVFANENFAKMLGYDLEEFQKSPVDKFLDTHNAERLKRDVESCLKGEPASSELVWRRKDGRPLSSLTSRRPVSYPIGQEASCLLVITDITLQKIMEKQVQQNEKMEALGILAGGIAHDFNNICAVVTGNLSYALSIADPKSELHEVLSDTMEGVGNARELTSQLLTFSKGGAPVRTSANLNEIVEGCAKFMLRGSKSKCSLDLAADLWSCELDKGQFSQVISNLILNASQSMPEGGVISVSTSNVETAERDELDLPGTRYIEVRIADEGVGIAEQNLSKIFDPFFSTKQTGSGLGLATSHSIVKNHSGEIRAHSEVDKGTVFHIYLPATEDAGRSGPKTEAPKLTAPTEKKRILVMDDQSFVLKMAGRLLRSMGHESAFAADGQEAVDMYEEAHRAGATYDLVILDITVPGGMGGTKTLARLLEIDPNVRAVVSSGYSRDPIMANYKDYGFRGVVPKPYTRGELAAVISSVISAG